MADIIEAFDPKLLTPDFLKAIGVKSISWNIPTDVWTISFVGEKKKDRWGYSTQTNPYVRGATLSEALDKLNAKSTEMKKRRALDLKKQATAAMKKAKDLQKQIDAYEQAAMLLQDQANQIEVTNG
jgi:hypothetical protein